MSKTHKALPNVKGISAKQQEKNSNPSRKKKKRTKSMNRQFTEEEIQKAIKHI